MEKDKIKQMFDCTTFQSLHYADGHCECPRKGHSLQYIPNLFQNITHCAQDVILDQAPKNNPQEMMACFLRVQTRPEHHYIFNEIQVRRR